jgi:acyl-CoA thioester hydrolase
MTHPAPFMSDLMEIDPAWIDFNNHLNMGYYTVLFDRAADQACVRLGFGPDYVRTRGLTTYSAEFHTRYLRELHLGDRVRASFRILDFDARRLHSFQELYHEDGWLSATGEGMALHVDLAGPHVMPMPPDILANVSAMAADHKKLPQPEGVGAVIGIRR